jgi:serine phosphatase RsbU (regulator of sigma subunit)/PAS domain-containing protein
MKSPARNFLSAPVGSEPHLEPILDHLGTALVSLDITHNVQYCNRLAAKWFDLPQAGIRAGRGLHCGQYPVLHRLLAPLLNRVPQFHDAVENFVEFPVQGGYLSLSVSVRSVEQGKLIQVDDITRERDYQSRMQAILGGAHSGLVVSDSQNRIILINSTFGRFFNLVAGQFQGTGFLPLIGIIKDFFEKPADFTRLAEELLANPTEFHERDLVLLAPHYRVFSFYSRPVKDDSNNFIGRLWSFYDITERVELAEELQQANIRLEQKVQVRTAELEIRNRELLQITGKLESAQEAVDEELRMARQVQESILPRGLPGLDGLEIAARYIPAQKVGGDFYDVIPVGNDRLFLMISDVSGHGVPSAMISMMASMSFSRNYLRTPDPARLAETINAELYQSIKTDHYLTSVMAWMNRQTGLLSFCRVCHVYPIIYRAETGDTEILNHNGGFFLGMFPQGKYSESQVYVNRGDKLLLYTDGLVESFNPRREQYGRRRLLKSVHRHAKLAPDAFLQALIMDKDRFTGNAESVDDITMLVVERK